MKVSVVIPMYNSQDTIIRALDSVKNQVFKPYEIIVVNDGSKDSSPSIVSEYIKNNTELVIKLINKENGGVSTARNAGMKEAEGEWIALLDSDDEWLSEKLSKQVEILKSNDQIDFLGTHRNDESFKKVLWKQLGYLSRISPKLLMVKFLFVVPTVIFKKEIIKDIGYFDETQKYAEEGNYFIRVANKFNCYLLNESLVITGGGKAHFGHSGLSGNLKEMEKGELKNLRFALDAKIINRFEYYNLVLFSILKYIRRVVVVKLRSNS